MLNSLPLAVRFGRNARRDFARELPGPKQIRHLP